ncbi:MAG: 2-hydroxy-3-oxopropionate reductase [Chloroflexi bacterium]|nr:2-hydroxy-3-oxopropionate reductase [Chloroflexota bacterium]
MVKRVGYIGVGGIGGPIAQNVLAGGFELMVYDLRQEAMDALAKLGAKTAKSAAELAEWAELIETSVDGDDAVLAAFLGKNGAMEGAKPGAIIAVHSTIHPSTVKKIAEVGKPKGVKAMDVNPTGGAEGVRKHTLVWLVGGDREDLDATRSVFETSGKDIFYMGPTGMGSAAKCAQQMITTVNMLAAYEGFRVAQAVGLDLEEFDKAVKLSTGQSYMADRWYKGFFNGMAAHGRDGFHKGLIPCLQLAHEVGVSAPGTALIQQIFQEFPDADGPRNERVG